MVIVRQRPFVVSDIQTSTLSLAELNSLSKGDQIRLEEKIDATLRLLTPTDRDALLWHSLNNPSNSERGDH
jgi:hypothetical protein